MYTHILSAVPCAYIAAGYFCASPSRVAGQRSFPTRWGRHLTLTFTTRTARHPMSKTVTRIRKMRAKKLLATDSPSLRSDCWMTLLPPITRSVTTWTQHLFHAESTYINKLLNCPDVFYLLRLLSESIKLSLSPHCFIWYTTLAFGSLSLPSMPI